MSGMRRSSIFIVLGPDSFRKYLASLIRILGCDEAILFVMKPSIEITEWFDDREIAVHEYLLRPILKEQIEAVDTGITGLVDENRLICFLDDGQSPVLSQILYTTLLQQLEEFHAPSGDKRGIKATVLHLGLNNERVDGLPLYPSWKNPISMVVRILLEHEKFLCKEEILQNLQLFDPDFTPRKLTSTLIRLENWLSLYPGWQVQHGRRTKKRYKLKTFGAL